jgi:predicted metal-dependent phosphoesterase TrpH
LTAPDNAAARSATGRRADPRRINADLHCHSTMSDGVLPPAEVVRRAHANGVQIHALTDHDEVGGLVEAAAEASRCGMFFVGGVEVSVTWGGETIHIVGLRVRHDDRCLVDGLARTRAGRDGRGREIAEQLERAGVPGAYEGALRYAGNPALLSRTHFARYIVEQGVCADVREVFQRFLVEGRPGYVPHRWAVLSEAVQWIRDAGGTAVLAHPGRYRLDDGGLWALMVEFRDAGGEGIEVVSGSHTPDQYGQFAAAAREFGFRASRGSDFHAPGESRVELGKLPPLPDTVVPVWHDWPEVQALGDRA